jgi:hypothetical protein
VFRKTNNTNRQVIDRAEQVSAAIWRGRRVGNSFGASLHSGDQKRDSLPGRQFQNANRLHRGVKMLFFMRAVVDVVTKANRLYARIRQEGRF